MTLEIEKEQHLYLPEHNPRCKSKSCIINSSVQITLLTKTCLACTITTLTLACYNKQFQLLIHRQIYNSLSAFVWIYSRKMYMIKSGVIYVCVITQYTHRYISNFTDKIHDENTRKWRLLLFPDVGHSSSSLLHKYSSHNSRIYFETETFLLRRLHDRWVLFMFSTVNDDLTRLKLLTSTHTWPTSSGKFSNSIQMISNKYIGKLAKNRDKNQ